MEMSSQNERLKDVDFSFLLILEEKKNKPGVCVEFGPAL